jgi:hypothetical protein
MILLICYPGDIVKFPDGTILEITKRQNLRLTMPHVSQEAEDTRKGSNASR